MKMGKMGKAGNSRMMYNGAKSRYTRGIVRLIRDLIPHGGTYWEPFVGSAKVIARVTNCRGFGSDLDRPIITLLQAVQDGWHPPATVTEEDYKLWQGRKDWDDPMVAFVGYGCSFSGKFFGGRARSRSGKIRNFAAEARRSLLARNEFLKGVELRVRDYRDGFWRPQAPSLIYCDPPYDGTTACGSVKTKFDSKEFWEWAEEQSCQSVVLVSEYRCPVAGSCLLWAETKGESMRRKEGGGVKTERLFCLRPELRKRIGFGF